MGWSFRIDVGEIISRHRKILILKPHRKLGVERERLRNARDGGHWPRELGIGQRHGQVDLVAHRMHRSGLTTAHRCGQVDVGNRATRQRRR
jgi:hypothetical protein